MPDLVKQDEKNISVSHSLLLAMIEKTRNGHLVKTPYFANIIQTEILTARYIPSY